MWGLTRFIGPASNDHLWNLSFLVLACWLHFSALEVAAWMRSAPLIASSLLFFHPFPPNLVSAPRSAHCWHPLLPWRGCRLPHVSSNTHEVASCFSRQGGASCLWSIMFIGSCCPPGYTFPLYRHLQVYIKEMIPHWLPISEYLKMILPDCKLSFFYIRLISLCFE